MRNVPEVGGSIQKNHDTWLEGRHLPHESLREHIKLGMGLLPLILSDVESKPLRLHAWMLKKEEGNTTTFATQMTLHTGGKLELAISKHLSHLTSCQLASRRNDIPVAYSGMREEDI